MMDATSSAPRNFRDVIAFAPRKANSAILSYVLTPICLSFSSNSINATDAHAAPAANNEMTSVVRNTFFRLHEQLSPQQNDVVPVALPAPGFCC
jgi:hypothetical protein